MKPKKGTIRPNWLRRTIQQRFDEKWIEDSLRGCWLWIGTKNRQGYGYFRIGHKMHKAHRVSWHLNTGNPPNENVCVLHKCDVPSCVNPDHLFLGTYSDNQVDALKKGRRIQPKGYGRDWTLIRKTGIQLRSRCPRDHPFDRKNLYINKHGHHVCRECARISYIKRRRETGKPVVIS